jgi:choice-of-anchor B domain-containing protein
VNKSRVVAILLLAWAMSPTVGFSASRLRDPLRDELSGFGHAVAIAGEYAFVGEPSEVLPRAGGEGPAAVIVPGVVHVYRRGPTGWKEVDKLVNPGSAGRDGFGIALATDGTTLLVGQVIPPGGGAGGRGGGRGAAATPPLPDSARGAVFVYHRSATGKWTAAGTLDASRARAGSQFGTALAVAGDLALVGAPADSAGGWVYSYTRSRNGDWTLAATLPAQGVVAGDHFGASIAISGDRIAVGATAHDAKGAVYVFKRAADGSWSQESSLESRAIPDNAQLGAAVALKGDRVFAGAPGASFPPAPVAVAPGTAPAAGRQGGGGGGRGNAVPVPGMAVVFEQNPAKQWRAVATLMPFDFSNARFGSSLAAVGDELWIGAPLSDGMGRIFRAKADKDGNWTGMTKLDVDSIDAGAQFGATFAVSTDGAVIGMPGDGGGGGTVAFLGKSPTGNWLLKSTTFPPVPDALKAVSGKEVKCGDDGMAAEFGCSNTGLVSFMPLSQLGVKRGVRLSGMWGWTDPVTGHDIALVGRTDGAAFVDVTDGAHPRYLGDLMRTAGATISSWREIKTYKNYALIVSDGSGDHHGIQIFDLTHLRNVTTPKHFVEDAHYYSGSIHDIVVNEQSGFAYAMGTSSGGETCSGGSQIVDIRDTKHPKFAGCFADAGTGRRGTGYTHDGQCVMYHGPDKKFADHEICINANETHISVQDVTDKSAVKVLAHVSYPNVSYAHQGWFTDDQKYWYEDDELDEGGFPGTTGANGNGPNCPCGKSVEGTRTLIWDMTDLSDPVLVNEFIGTTHATDHNQYVKGNRLFQSNYRAGLRILDISDPVHPREVGYLDTYPYDDNKEGGGTWSNYPFFKNGLIGVSSITEGLFMVRDRSIRVVP